MKTKISITNRLCIATALTAHAIKLESGGALSANTSQCDLLQSDFWYNDPDEDESVNTVQRVASQPWEYAPSIGEIGEGIYETCHIRLSSFFSWFGEGWNNPINGSVESTLRMYRRRVGRDNFVPWRLHYLKFTLPHLYQGNRGTVFIGTPFQNSEHATDSLGASRMLKDWSAGNARLSKNADELKKHLGRLQNDQSIY